MNRPETRYARAGNLHIAYQIAGDGPIDLIWVPGFLSHVEDQWDIPWMANLFERLASFSRLIVFDKRGSGLSDPIVGASTLEERMDDLRAVMDAAGSEHAAIYGASESGSMAALFAATYPQRVSALLFYGAFARFAKDNDYPWGADPAMKEGSLALVEQMCVKGVGLTIAMYAPSLVDDESAKQAWNRLERRCASPGTATALFALVYDIDVRNVLPAIQAPTLVLHRTGDSVVDVEHGRYLSEHIPGAKLVELPGVDHFSFDNWETIADEVQVSHRGPPRA